MVTKISHILKQTCSFQLQVCLSVCDLFLPQGIKGLSLKTFLKCNFSLDACQWGKIYKKISVSFELSIITRVFGLSGPQPLGFTSGPRPS